MQIPPFTLNRQYHEIGSEIESEVSKVLKGGQYIGGNEIAKFEESFSNLIGCLLYTSPSPRDATLSRMPSSA